MKSEWIAEIVRRALDAGQSVDIEGLGTFSLNRNDPAACQGGYTFVPEESARVFIAYAVEDLAGIRRLCDALRAERCSPWLDKEKLLPGQNWPRAIERAIDVADAFVACFSSHSTRKRGQFQSELRYALDCARKRPLDEAFFIPVRMEECEVPRSVTERVQYLDLFPDWKMGVRRLARAIRKASQGRPVARLATLDESDRMEAER